jgi:succinylglutamate desuccinylase
MKGVTRKNGTGPGKTVAVIGGVHGNESVGMSALRWARETITPEAGTVYFIEGNPEAVRKNVRFIEKNLNRCFSKELSGDSLEELRARELMPILDECDMLLDIHASNSHDATPFVICEENGMEIGCLLDFPIISTGWDALEPGTTDWYVNQQRKIGIGIECGSVHRPEETLTLAQESILRFLRYTGNLEGGEESHDIPQRHIHVHTVAHRSTEPVTFSRDYADFELLEHEEVFARSGDREYVAGQDDCIIFPRPNAPFGAEIFILGREIPS